MKKLLIVFSAVITMFLTAISGYAIVGDGSEETPFVITNQDELRLVSDFPACYFELENDISLNGIWEPLCQYANDFTGVFDGKGHTISNLQLGSYSSTGLFRSNSGTIKNLNITTSEQEYSITPATCLGIIAGENNGTISNCNVKGKVLISKQATNSVIYVGSAAGINNGTINFVTTNLNITSGTYKQYVNANGIETVTKNYILNAGGVVGENSQEAVISNCASKGSLCEKSGGIAYSNKGKISNSYFKGAANCGIVCSSSGTVENCYAAATGASCGIGTSALNCFYDRGKCSDQTGDGGKTTLAMKMKKTYTDAKWDFDTVWGIDSNINNGYPYLLFEYSNVQEQERYTLNSVKLTNANGLEITEIPDDKFYVEVNATKNDNSKDTDFLIIALYDENDKILDIKFLSGVFYQNQKITFGAFLDNVNKNAEYIKTFVWNNLSGMVPLSNSLTK